MKRIKYILLMSMLVGALFSTAKADVVPEDTLQVGFRIAAPPSLCEGGYVDVSHCLDTVSYINEVAEMQWIITRPGRPTNEPELRPNNTPIQVGDILSVRIRNWRPTSQSFGSWHLSDTVSITVFPKSRDTLDTVVCDSYRWPVNNTLYTEGGTYIHVSPNADTATGCDSVYTLYLTVNNSVHETIDTVVCDSCHWHNRFYSASGRYVYPYTDVNGCTSDTTLFLTINHFSINDIYVTTCDSYLWDNGMVYYTSAVVSLTLEDTNRYGCDSVNRLNLTVNYSTNSTMMDTACDSYRWIDGNVYNASNDTATHVITNRAGCDSTIHLHLTVYNSNLAGTDTASVCDSYLWNGQTYTQGGTYRFYTQTNHGCDSMCTLSLTIKNSSTGIETITDCDSNVWHGITYTETTDTPTYTSTNVEGCDSVTTLHLTINYSNEAVETVTACDSYTWHGVNYSASTDSPTFTSTNVSGCDSVTILHLTIGYSNEAIETVTACDNYLWHGTMYNVSTTTPTYTCENAAGCDSMTTLHLTINHSDTISATATACEEYTWYGRHYLYSGDYRFDTVNNNSCYRLMTLKLTINHGTHNAVSLDSCEQCTWHGTVYTSDGTYTWNYQNQYDCPSVDTLHLIIYGTRIPESRNLVLKKLGTDSPQMIIFPRGQGESEYAYEWYRDGNLIENANKQYYRLNKEDQGLHTFAVHVSPIEQKRCFSVSDTLVSVNPQTQDLLNVSPNPNNGVFTVTLTSQEEAVEAAFYSVYGTLVATLPATDNMVKVGGELPDGVYMVNVTTRKGEVYTTKIVIR